MCLCASLSGAGKITATPQPHLNHEPTALARAQLAHPRTHPPQGAAGTPRHGTGTTASRKWMPRRALGRGQGEGRTLKRSALCQQRAETPKPNRAGRLKRRPTTCCTPATKQVEHHDIQEGRRLHLREVSQAAERKKRARQSSAALLFCRLECWTSLLLRWVVVM